FLNWRHFKCPSQTIAKCERRLHVPSVTEIDVVVRDSALIKGRRQWRIQSQVGSVAGINLLGDGNDAHHGRVVTAKVRARRTGRGIEPTHSDSRPSLSSELVYGLIIDAP